MRDRVAAWIFLIPFLFPLVSAAAQTDRETGLIVAPGLETVKENCTVCHSAQLIIRNRMDREGWLETIRWMQAEQGLWEFEPEVERKILDYLSTHYSIKNTYRRPPLKVEWD